MDHPPPERPAFRHLDVQQIADGEQRGVVLIDPTGLVSGQVFVPEGLLPLVGRIDGARTAEDIRSELAAEFDQEVPLEVVTNLVRQLDEGLLLLSPRYHDALERAVTELVARGVRPARHAGSAGYPARPDALREALDSMVRRGSEPNRPAPRGLVAPHIDLARGREGYAQAYGYLAECEAPDLFVVFGTGHQGPGSPVTGLPVDWETPIGTVRTDRDFVAAVHERVGPPHPHDVFLHRHEHSLEFQMLLLTHVFAHRDVRVAGFLTGSLGHHGVSASDELLDAFRAVSVESGREVCFVAGADLAHLGPFFGDTETIAAPRLERLDHDERGKLAHLERGDAAGFHAAVEASGNPDRICGGVPIYLTAALAGGVGTLLHYGQAAAPDGSQVVSFCSMAFESDATTPRDGGRTIPSGP